MSTSPTSGSSGPIRIGNFFSSFDTEAIINQLTQARQAPLYALDAKQALIGQRQKTLTSLTTQFTALLSRANSLFNSTSVSGKSASVTGAGVNAAAGPTAAPGTFSVAVTQLASATTAVGTPITAAVNSGSLLSASNFGTAVTAGAFTMKAATGALTTITVDPATQSLDVVANLINGQEGTSGIHASITADANGRLNILHLVSTQGAIQLGAGGDTSNFLEATNLAASPGTTTRDSTMPIARINGSDKMSVASFFGGAPAAGAHSFTINGATINYDASVDSLNDVLNRINASTAGVTAAFDALTDKITLTQTKLGSLSMTLADDGAGGDFLAKTGLLSATQSLGVTAQYSINGGATQFASSNTVTPLPGTTLTLTALTGATPATVTISQNSSGAVTAVKSFVSDYNALLQSLGDATKADKTSAGPFSGDSALISLRSTLRSLITGNALNPSGKYGDLGAIGLSFGAFGSAVGSTTTLQLDEAKFTAALASDPVSVQSAFSGFTLTPTLTPAGTGSITGMTGSYLGAKAGTYDITDDGLGNLTALFTPSDGGVSSTATATVTAGGSDTALIPGMTLSIAAVLAAGTHTVTVAQTSSSVMRKMKDFLDGQVGAYGTLSKRQDEFTAINKDIEARRIKIQSSIDAEMALMRKKFIAMEQAQARASSISSSLTQMVAQLSSSSTTK